MKFLYLAIFVALVAGCAGRQASSQTREESIAMKTRVYSNADPERVIAAAERLLTLADGKDFSFSHTESGFQASRRWSVYLVIAAAFGTDTWAFSAVKEGAGTKATVIAATSAQSASPMPVATSTGGGVTASTGPQIQGAITSTALYDLFWRRMDFLLGQSDKWLTCNEWDDYKKTLKLRGDDSALCNSFNVDDIDPRRTADDDPNK